MSFWHGQVISWVGTDRVCERVRDKERMISPASSLAMDAREHVAMVVKQDTLAPNPLVNNRVKGSPKPAFSGAVQSMRLSSITNAETVSYGAFVAQKLAEAWLGSLISLSLVFCFMKNSFLHHALPLGGYLGNVWMSGHCLSVHRQYGLPVMGLCVLDGNNKFI